MDIHYRAAGHEYSVNEKLVRDWRKKKAELEHYCDDTLQYEAFVCSRCHPLLVNTHTHNWWARIRLQ